MSHHHMARADEMEWNKIKKNYMRIIAFVTSVILHHFLNFVSFYHAWMKSKYIVIAVAMAAYEGNFKVLTST